MDKVAVIAGGAQGIGRAAASMFAVEGAKIAVIDIDLAGATAAAQAVLDAGGEALAVRADATDEDSVAAAFERAVAHFGKVDVLLNTAGGSIPKDAPLADVDLDDVWSYTMNLDVRGTMLCCRHALRHMLALETRGTIVNMSSGAALRGSSSSHVYTAAKGAIVSLTRVLAGTYARHGIRVNAICSGRINTERIRQTYGIPGQPGKTHDPMSVDEQIKVYPFWFGEPEDMAAIALFLASDESRMITGASIPADGGRSAY